MKTYTGTIELYTDVYYTDSITAPCTWVARIILKKRNSGKIVKIERNKINY